MCISFCPTIPRKDYHAPSSKHPELYIRMIFFRLHLYHFRLPYQESSATHSRPNILNHIYIYMCVHFGFIHICTYFKTVSIFFWTTIPRKEKIHPRPNILNRSCLAPQLFMLRFISGLYCCWGTAEFTLVIYVYM